MPADEILVRGEIELSSKETDQNSLVGVTRVTPVSGMLSQNWKFGNFGNFGFFEKKLEIWNFWNFWIF